MNAEKQKLQRERRRLLGEIQWAENELARLGRYKLLPDEPAVLALRKLIRQHREKLRGPATVEVPQ